MTNKTASKWFYSVYGLDLVSNQPISALIPLSGQVSPEQIVRIDFDENEKPLPLDIALQQIYASPGIAHNGNPFFQIWKSGDTSMHLIICYTNGDGIVQFLLNRNGTEVCVKWDKKIAFGDILTYFLGPVLGCLLRLRQCMCLHAGVVAVGNKAIAIIGTKGAGKSTTTAALACYQQLPILSDDIAVISMVNNQYFVQPGYPRLRLWPEAIDCMPRLEIEKLPNILSITNKRYVELSVDDSMSQWRFQKQPLPLVAVYLLDMREAGSVSLQPLPGGESLFALATNVYPEYTLDSALRVDDFKFFGKLIDLIPVRKVCRPNALDTLPFICQAIIDDVDTIVNRITG